MNKVKGLLFLLLLVIQNCYPLITKMVVFGDSISDTGNLYRYSFHFLPKSPPYYHGHFSNGPLWVEYLANMLKVNSENYATGGVSAVFTLNTKQLPYSINAEINAYHIRHPTKAAAKNTLFVIWIGANDYLNGRDNVNQAAFKTVYGIYYAIWWLKKTAGGKYFLILNLPDLGASPLAINHYSKRLQKNLTALSMQHNKYLQQAVKALRRQNPETTIMLFDTHKLFNDFAHNKKKYQLKYVTVPCYTGRYDFTHYLKNFNKNIKHITPPLSAYQLYIKAPIIKTRDCTPYLFWDRVHPTTRIHKILAQKFYQQIQAQY